MRSREIRIAAIVFVVALAFFGLLFRQFPVLYDTDAYYHLAVARAYAEHGLIDDLPWARLSLLHRGFGDKEWLFHVLLAPFSRSPAAGRWALAVLNATLATVLAVLGVSALGRWGLTIPVLVYAGSLEYLGRAIRLRPELLGLLLLIAAAGCAGRRRYRLLGVVALVYTSSYTAFQALLGLCLVWFVHAWWTSRGAERRRAWALLLYPVLGVALGLLLHPHLPHNVTVWKVQNVDFFTHKATLDVGSEIHPQTADQVLVLNLAWALGLVVLWRSRRRSEAASPADGPAPDALADVFLIAAAAFGVLYCLMLRFSTYFVPFAALAVIFAIRRRGGLGAAVALPWRGRLPLAPVLAAVAVLGAVQSGHLLSGLAGATPETGPSREAEWAAFGRAVPPGAKVAADWGATHLYMYWAPQASYLNVLDPVFMALPHPDAHATLRAVLDSREPDVPRALREGLDSDHLAVSRFHQPQELLIRLSGDPRLELVYSGYTLLYRLADGANRAFVLDWRAEPAGTRRRDGPPDLDEVATWPRYPRAADPAVRAIEGYVDATRLGAGRGCSILVHLVETDRAVTRTYEIAPYGPATVWLDDELVLQSRAPIRAVVSHRLRFSADWDAGVHRLTVRTCAVRERQGLRSGFYLRSVS